MGGDKPSPEQWSCLHSQQRQERSGCPKLVSKETVKKTKREQGNRDNPGNQDLHRWAAASPWAPRLKPCRSCSSIYSLCPAASRKEPPHSVRAGLSIRPGLSFQKTAFRCFLVIVEYGITCQDCDFSLPLSRWLWLWVSSLPLKMLNLSHALVLAVFYHHNTLQQAVLQINQGLSSWFIFLLKQCK